MVMIYDTHLLFLRPYFMVNYNFTLICWATISLCKLKKNNKITILNNNVTDISFVFEVTKTEFKHELKNIPIFCLNSICYYIF